MLKAVKVSEGVGRLGGMGGATTVRNRVLVTQSAQRGGKRNGDPGQAKAWRTL